MTASHFYRTTWSLSAMALILILLVGGMSENAAGEQGHLKVVIASGKTPADRPTLIALDQGLFQAHGVETEVRFMDSEQDSLRALLAGQADYALMPITPLLLHYFGSDPQNWDGDGSAPVILAALADQTELVRLVIRADTDLHSATAESPLRIGFEPDSTSEYVWWLYRQFYALAADQFERQALAHQPLLAGLRSGQLDGAVLSSAQITELLADAAQEGNWTILSSGHLFTGKWLLVTTRENAEDNALGCARLLAAYANAMDFMRNATAQVSVQPLPAWAFIPKASSKDEFNPEDLVFRLHLDWSLLAAMQQQLMWIESRRARHDPRPGQPELLDIISSKPLSSVGASDLGLPLLTAESAEP